MSSLPVDIDSTYPGDGGDPTVDLHQQYHDVLHEAVNALNSSYGIAVTNGYAGTKIQWFGLIAAAQGAAEKGQPNGYAGLDVNGKVPSTQLPALALTDVAVVADITARDALTVEEGDVAVVTDAGGGLSRSYVYDGAVWQELQTPTDAVASVDGRTGTVTLSDLYASAAEGDLAATAVQPGALAPVATSGAYADLTGSPTLGTAADNDEADFATAAQGTLAGTAVQPGDLAAVATSGDYEDLVGAPVLVAPDSTVYRILVDNAGVLSTEVVV